MKHLLKAIQLVCTRPSERLPSRSFHPVPPAPFGLVERRVSLGRQVVGAAAGLGTGGYPERGAEWPGATLPVPRRSGQLEANPLGDAGAELKVGLRQPDGELLTSNAAGNIAGADLFPDDAGKVHQRRIAGGMTEGVVQALETIEVAIQQRAVPRRNRPEGLVETAPVTESSQRIDRGCSLVLVGFQSAVDARGGIVNRFHYLGSRRARGLFSSRKPDGDGANRFQLVPNGKQQD